MATATAQRRRPQAPGSLEVLASRDTFGCIVLLEQLAGSLKESAIELVMLPLLLLLVCLEFLINIPTQGALLGVTYLGKTSCRARLWLVERRADLGEEINSLHAKTRRRSRR